MTDTMSSMRYEDKIRAALSTPDPAPQFVDRLEAQLLSYAHEQTPVTKQSKDSNGRSSTRLRQPARLAALVVLLAFLVIFLVLGPQNVYAAIMKFFGYLPGVGVVDQNTPIRVLSEPVAITREDITLTVLDAYLTDEKTILSYSIDNIPYSALSHDENIVGCSEPGSLLLPDGTTLKIKNGWGSQGQSNNTYAPIPNDIDEARFMLPCLPGTLPGKAPENWDVPLQFNPAPPDLTIAPVMDIATSTPPESDQETVEPRAAASHLYGIEIGLDQAIRLSDGYYLIGHTQWADERIAAAYPGGWAMKAFDEANQEIPLEPVSYHEAGLDNLQPDQWVYKIYGETFNGPLTLRMTVVGVEFVQPVSFNLTPSQYGFNGSGDQPDTIREITPISLDIPGVQAEIVYLKSMRQGMLTGFELGISSDPQLKSLGFSLVSEVTGGRGSSGGGSNRDQQTGLVQSYILSDGQMSYPLALSAQGASFSGLWETVWTPPVIDPQLTPTAAYQSCMTMDKWQAALQNPPAIPADLPQRVFVSRGAVAPNPSLFIASPDGSYEQGLVFGNGSLLPDGSRLVYDDRSSQIKILDLDNNQTVVLSSGKNDRNPYWSPDGALIAFMRTGDNPALYTMKADGSDQRLVIPVNNSAQLAGWAPDGTRLLYSEQTEGYVRQIRTVDIESGMITDLFEVDSEAPSPVISPDGKQIAYLSRVTGRMANGIYISALDGSAKCLIVQMDYWPVSSAVWSPDGAWLSFSVINTDLFSPTSTAVLLNVETCQMIPLTNFRGIIQSWVSFD